MNYALAQPWLAQAQEDMQTARALFDLQRYGPCAFFCQQSAEKALKAILYYRDERPWGHKLLELLIAVETTISGPLPKVLQQAAESLDTHYTTPRYPDAHVGADPTGGYDVSVATEAIENARAFLALAQREVRS